MDFKVTFANTHTPESFERRSRCLSTTTVMCEVAGVDFCRVDYLLADGSLFMEFTK